MSIITGQTRAYSRPINISNFFKLLQDMEENAVVQQMVKYNAREHTTTMVNEEEGERMEGTNPNDPPNE